MARGYIRKWGDRSWQIAYDLPRAAAASASRPSTATSARQRRAPSKPSRTSRGRARDVTRLTLGDFLEQWLRDHAVLRVRPRTLDGYRHIVDSAIKPALGHIRLSELTAWQVDAFYTAQMRAGRSAYTVIHHHRLLRQAVKWEMFTRNVTDTVRPPPTRRKSQLQTLTADQVQRLLGAASSAGFLLPVQLAVRTGLHRSEVLGLRWQAVDLPGCRLTVTRTMTNFPGDPAHVGEPKSLRSRRTVTYDEQTGMMLRARREAAFAEAGIPFLQEIQVCVRPDGRLMKPASLSQAFQRIAAAKSSGSEKTTDVG